MIRVLVEEYRTTVGVQIKRRKEGERELVREDFYLRSSRKTFGRESIWHECFDR